MKNIFCIFLLIQLISACQNKAAKNDNAENESVTITLSTADRISSEAFAGSCPYLTKDHQGNPVLSWTEQQDTARNYLLCYAISRDGGQTFGETHTIPTTRGVYPHDENLSKIVFKPNGDIIALFAVSNPNPENDYAGLVYYTQSFDNGTSWTAPAQLANDTINSIDERYFDIALLPDGEVGAVWLDSRKDSNKEGSTLFFSSTKGRNGFIGERIIDQHTCQCCRTDLYVDEKSRLHVAYRAILNDSVRDMMHIVSSDNGLSFSKPSRISADNWAINGCPHTGPALTSNANGMHFAWFTMGGGSGVFYNQLQDGKNFTPRESVSSVPSAKHPQITTLANGNIAIVWDEKYEKEGKFDNRIGLQLRSTAGKAIHTVHLTSDTVSAVFPVILTVDEENLLVAYTQTSGATKQVWYQVIKSGNPLLSVKN